MKNQSESDFSRDNVFSFLQRLSQSFMLPIAMMPIAGFLLAIGSSFTQDITVANLGLTAIIHDGTILYQILTLMKTIGKLIIDNLSLLFAISVAIGFSDRKKVSGARPYAASARPHGAGIWWATLAALARRCALHG